MAKQKFYLPIVNREYRGENGFYTVSPICENKEDAEKFLSKEYERLSAEFGGFEDWEVTRENDTFSCIDFNNYNLWGWVQEIEVESEFTGHRFAYVVFSIQHIDGADDNDELCVDIVFTDAQEYQQKVYDRIEEIISQFKEENPADEYEETDEKRLKKHWSKSVGFENGDESEEGELNLWFEIHDII